MKKAESDRQFDESELFLGTPVKCYSSGMYVRLAFAVVAHLEFGFEQRSGRRY